MSQKFISSWILSYKLLHFPPCLSCSHCTSSTQPAAFMGAKLHTAHSAVVIYMLPPTWGDLQHNLK